MKQGASHLVPGGPRRGSPPRYWGLRLWVGCALALACHGSGSVDDLARSRTSSAVLRTTREVRAALTAGTQINQALQLEGLVLAVNPRQGWVVIRDETGSARLHVDPDHYPMTVGQRVLIEGPCLLQSGAVQFGARQRVDHDGLHGAEEKSGRFLLSAGKHPFLVEFFDHNEDEVLELAYEGPGIPKQTVPAERLFRRRADGVYEPGLDYRYYEGTWTNLPNFAELTPVKTGTTTTLDLSLRNRDNEFALEFRGFVEIPRDGEYTFYLKSDDGSRLSIQDEDIARVRTLGPGTWPAPRLLTPGQALASNDEYAWAEVEGQVSFVGESPEGLMVELASDLGRLPIRVAGATITPGLPLLNARLRARGVCEPAFTDRPDKTAGCLWVASGDQVHLVELPGAFWQSVPEETIALVKQTDSAAKTTPLVRIRGIVRSAKNAREYEIEDDTGRLRVLTQDGRVLDPGTPVEVLGRPHSADGTTLLVNGVCRLAAGSDMPESHTSLPVLTTIEQIHRLKPEEARKAYPVRVRAVLTFREGDGLRFVQDPTRGIYLNGWPEGVPSLPGGCYAIEGTSGPGDFAPVIEPLKLTYLGLGRMPEPARPSWEQLASGTMDSQYVEVEGIVVSVEESQLQLELHGGRAQTFVYNSTPEQLRARENALVRVRGCAATVFNTNRQVSSFTLHVTSPEYLTVVEPPPADPFQVPAKTVAEFRQFDPNASGLRRVRVAGQVVHFQDRAGYLMDGGSGLRFFTRIENGLKAGDLVEVAGFSEVGAVPALREAVVRKKGQRALPAVHVYQPDELLKGDRDATLVRLEAVLLNQRGTTNEVVFELQGEQRAFLARMRVGVGNAPALRPGSVLRLTGICAGQSGAGRTDGGLDSFEFLLNSPEDITVIRAPARFTLRHALPVIGVLLLLVVLALVWITTLRHRVDQRTRDLKKEIDQHKHTTTQLQYQMEVRNKAEREVERSHKQLVDASRRAGMAEVATGVLHNVGNVLNSVNVSANLISEKIKTLQVGGVSKLAQLLAGTPDLAAFITLDERGKQVPAYLTRLGEQLNQEQKALLAEFDSLRQNVDHVKEIVATQQSYAQRAGLTESLNVRDLLEDVLRIHAQAYTRHGVQVTRDYGDVPAVRTDRHKILQILVNLFSNAKRACDDGGAKDKLVTVRARLNGENRVRIEVTDNGVGITPENLTMIFTHGFTTRKGGHGFGLHSGALAARELGGSLTATSPGPGQGATFVLELPLVPPETGG
jgi:signal transduction histidine kinase